MEINIIPKFIDEAASAPAQAVGNTLADIWGLAIGNHVSLWTKKQEIRQQQNLQSYIQKVENKTQGIPEEFLKEPELHIIGPAIEASKYYIGSEELREMFANLIASSIDIRKSGITHPSFIEIIKQLSPMDAGIIENFKEATQSPIAELRMRNETVSFVTIQRNVMNFKINSEYKLQATSISNLERLGLLKIDYSIHSSSDLQYEYVKLHPSFVEATNELANNPNYNRIEFEKGLCLKTPLGEDFINACL